MDETNYWKRWRTRRLSRRGVLGSGVAASAGLAGLALVGCGDDDDDDDDVTPTQGGASPGASPAASPTAAPTEGPVKGGKLRLGTFLDVLGIDPHIEVGLPGLTQAWKVYTGLGGFISRDQFFLPRLAEKLEQPSDVELIFTIRQDVKFPNVDPMNGRQLTAEDALYSFERFRDHPQAQNNAFFKTNVASMTVPDGFTFRVETNAPFAEAVSEMSSIQKQIVGREDVEKRGDLSAGGIGVGPYKIDQYEKGRYILLSRNEESYLADQAYPDQLEWTTILDMGTLLQAYKSDQMDVNGALLTKLDFDDLKGNDDLVNHEQPALHYGSLAVNVANPPFNNPLVRQALWVGIDRKQIVERVFQGAARPMGIVNPGLEYWVLAEDELEPYLTVDYEKAKSLLAEAGFPDGFEMTIDTSNGVQLYIDHLDVIVPELEKIGITVKPQITDLTTYLNTKLFVGGFEQGTIFTHNPYESPKIPLGFYHTKGLGNGSWWHYSNAEADTAIDAQNAAVDIEERQGLVYEAQRVLLKDFAPLINQAAPTLFNSHHKRVGGVDFTLRNGQAYQISEYLKES